MSRLPKILFVVEGRKTERGLVSRMAEVFGLKAEVYSVNANIYALYQKVKDDPFAITVEVLSEMRNSESDREVLDQDFTDVFLVFDCDAQHTLDPHERNRMSEKEIALRNLDIVRQMAERFDDSTDAQKGKLFVNYPMVESFRDCDNFFEDAYADRAFPISSLGGNGYKRSLVNRKLIRRHVDSFTRGEFAALMRMNVFKLNALTGTCFGPPSYDEFLHRASQSGIAEQESTCVAEREEISVLNTLLFFPLEYFGNRSRFYEGVVRP